MMGRKDSLSWPGGKPYPSREELFLESFLESDKKMETDLVQGDDAEEMENQGPGPGQPRDEGGYRGYESPLESMQARTRGRETAERKSSPTGASSAAPKDLFSEARGALSLAAGLNPTLQSQRETSRTRQAGERQGGQPRRVDWSEAGGPEERESRGLEKAPEKMGEEEADFVQGHTASERTKSGAEPSRQIEAATSERDMQSFLLSNLPDILPYPVQCDLPPIELLEETHQPMEPFLQFAQELTNNLFGLGAGAKIIRISPSLRQTRYTLRPQPEVKQSRILSLQEELEIRLRVSDLRFEAKGEDLILYVKNERVLPIPLRNLLTQPGFTKVQGGIPVALGRYTDRSPAILDLAALPHLLIGGMTGTGKTVLLESLITSILYSRTPQEVRLVLCSDGQSLKSFAGLPHLLFPLCQDPGRTVKTLWALCKEMDRRTQLFHSLGVGSYSRYQRKKGELEGEPQNLPRIVLFMDELSYSLKVHGEESRKALMRLSREGEMAGIHLVLSSKEPIFWLLPAHTMGMFPARACFLTENAILSQMVIGDEGAKDLHPDGELLLGVGNKPLAKLQGAYVSPQELERIRDFYTQRS